MTPELCKYPWDATCATRGFRDILHHVAIPKTVQEIVRVSTSDALFVVNETYSHSLTEEIRHAPIVEKVLYPRMRQLIFGSRKPYITEEKGKLSEHALPSIARQLQPRQLTKHFNFVMTRVIPDRLEALAEVDRLLLRILSPIGQLLAGWFLFSARIKKPPVGET